MGYVSVFLALLAGTTKGFFGKRISAKAATQRQSVFVNAVRMVFCVLISFIVLAPEMLRGGIYLDASAWLFGSLAGVTLSLFLVTWLLAVRRGAFMLISVTQMFGVVVTIICAFLVFRTAILPRQILAILILSVAVVIMGSYSTSLKGKLSIGTVLLLLLCGVSSGLYDFSLKLFTHYSGASISTLNLISYAVAALVLAFVFLLPAREDRFDAKEMLRATFLPILIMSMCLFLNSYFKVLANHYLTTVQVYPIYQAGGLIFSAAMSAIFFKEKITARCVVGLVLAFVSILLLK